MGTRLCDYLAGSVLEMRVPQRWAANRGGEMLCGMYGSPSERASELNVNNG